MAGGIGMSLDAMKQALAALENPWAAGAEGVADAIMTLRAAIEQAHDWDEVEALRESLREHMAEIHRLRAVIQKSVEPIAWVYPEALEAFKSGKPWTAYGENGDGPYPDGVKRIPLYLSDAVAPRVEPPVAESGAGFESLPASPQLRERNT